MLSKIKFYESKKGLSSFDSTEQAVQKAMDLLNNIKKSKGDVLLLVFTLNDFLARKKLKYKDIGTNIVEIQRIVDMKVNIIDDSKSFFESCKKVA